MNKNLMLTLSNIEKKFNKSIASNIHIGTNLLEKISSQFNNRKILLISDNKIVTNNKDYFQTLKQRLNAKSYILANPICDNDTAKDISALVGKNDLIIAFGSGTINDLCKYVADQHHIDYCIIASAYSMNGYLSQNTSITINGHKKTIPAKAPIDAFFDIEMMNKSPIRLTQSGIFDVTCSYLIENDWLLSNFLEMDNDYDQFYFAVQEPYLDHLYDNLSKTLANQDNLSLLNLLIITGVLMNFCESSKPASQGEHLIAHLLDMTNSFKQKYLHGEQVLVGSVLSYQVQSAITINYMNFKFNPKSSIYFDEIFPAQYSDSCRIEYNSKFQLIKSNRRLPDFMHFYTKILPQILYNLAYTKKFFTKFSDYNIPLKPSDYITDSAKTDYALNYSSLIRNRFTHLDLLFHGKISN